MTSILSSFSEIMSIHNGRPGALNLPPFSVYKSLSSCIRQASSGVMLVVIMLVWSDSKCLEAKGGYAAGILRERRSIARHT